MKGKSEVEDMKVELMARLLSQIRANRDRRTTGMILEDLLKIPKYATNLLLPQILSKSARCKLLDINIFIKNISLYYIFLAPPLSPQKQLKPIEVKVEDSVASGSTDNQESSLSLLSVNTGETNVEKAAKQEAQVMARIAELRRSGLWTTSRLPLCVEPPRNKTHWDFVLEEMKWMSTDFKMERNFKRNMARKIAVAICRQNREQEMEIERAEMRIIKDGKRICASIAKMVRDFWQNVDKVVDYRAQVTLYIYTCLEILESKKRKALDQHLAFIVGEADKLSSMVQEGLQQEKTSKTPSVASKEDLIDKNDNDFNGSDSESDDERTIAREELAMQGEDVRGEVNALAKEADQDIDDLLASLPPEYLASLSMHIPPDLSSTTGSASVGSVVESDSEAESDENINDSEKLDNDYEDLGPSSCKRSRIEGSGSEEEKSKSSTEVDESSQDTRSEHIDLKEGNGDGRGMLEHVDYAKLNSENSDERQQELANIAEEALKFQPKGFTLETTQVKTEVPFLIRGKLREYQMVGLDWLVTLYEKNLNGILADEMGLGKTIQTISLLAHLACTESIWGPHLIVVPTSVILNWEMELKKWCPAFKILTYFGSQKDRIEKRKGWSKPNAFHVCITSYKTITTDIRSFKMKAWQYLILDEAQNIKNWKSQRWQDWFSNPLTGMMEGNVEFSAPLVQRLHKVLRPFILRRLKSEVEKQLPEKTEHIVKCQLSKRQRYLYDDFMSQRSTRDNLKSGNMMSVLNIVMQLRKCCNHPNLFEPRPVLSPFVLPPMRAVFPAILFDLVGKNARLDEENHTNDVPACLDLRDRLTGWTTNAKNRKPLIEELEHQEDPIPPPFVPGFRFQRPAMDAQETFSPGPSSAAINSVVDVSAAELQRAGFGQNEMFLVVGEGDDLESLLSNSAGINLILNTARSKNVISLYMYIYCNYLGAPVPMRVRVDGGKVVLDSGDTQQQAGRARLCQVSFSFSYFLDKCKQVSKLLITCYVYEIYFTALQVVTGMNGEKTLRDVVGHYRDSDLPPIIADGNAPVPVTHVATPAPYSAAAVPGMATAVTKPPSLCTTTVVSPMTPLTVSTASTGFHHVQQNGGARESIVNYNYQFSPPLKRRRTSVAPLISGEFMDCVPTDVCEKMDEARRHRLECAVRRFGCIHQPLISWELINVLWRETRKVTRRSDEGWAWDGWNAEQEELREALNVWTERMVKKFVLHVDSAQSDAPLVFASSAGRPAYALLADKRRMESARYILENSHPLTDSMLLSNKLQFPELRLIELDGATSIEQRQVWFFNHCLVIYSYSHMVSLRDLFDGEVNVDDVTVPVDAPKDQKELEKAMASLEDEQDVAAAKMARAEARADRAEFDEGRAIQISQFNGDDSPDEKYMELISQLKPIERYAINFLEAEYKPEFEEEVKEAQALIAQKKEDWVRAHEKAMNEENGIEDDFYGAGNLLDEVRSRRGRPPAAAHRNRHAPTRHSARKIPKRISSPLKTSSGRRIVAPSSNFLSSSLCIKSATHLTSHSVSRKTAGRGRPRLSNVSGSSITKDAQVPNVDSISFSLIPKRGRGRPRKIRPEEDPPKADISKESKPSTIIIQESNTNKLTLPVPVQTPSPVPRLARVLLAPPVDISAPSTQLSPRPIQRPSIPVRTINQPVSRPLNSPQPIPRASPISSSSSGTTLRLPVRVVHPNSSPGPSIIRSSQVRQLVSPNTSPICSSPSTTAVPRTVYIRRASGGSGNPTPHTLSVSQQPRRFVVINRPGNSPNSSGVFRPPPLPVRVMNPEEARRLLAQRPGLGEYERPRLQFRKRALDEEGATDER
uniref:Helicase ATP-binding domain-containing protein n=1 Tax=Heterorhabditis bacteriophora TaxID=37862 RepID=A0A1I7XQP6_HETBA